MNEVLRDWLDLADQDFRAARLLRGSDEAFDEAVCFHVQQCIEKLMKALLLAHSVTPPKTHDLVELHNLLSSVEPEWVVDPKDLQAMTKQAIAPRYPGGTVSRRQATEMFEQLNQLRPRLLALIEHAAT